jgi:hypothetical protein
MTSEEAIELYPSEFPENERYTKHWNTFLADIADRDNFKKSHLIQLSILCSLISDYEYDRETIVQLGRTYETTGRNGLQHKARPELELMKKAVSDIRHYLNMLGLVLVEDKKMTNVKEESNDFE